MAAAPNTALLQWFRDSAIDQRQAFLDDLVQEFRPSDFRHMSRRLYPQQFVGDLVVLLPSEIVDIIFAHLEPQQLFQLRNVSTLWNDYLSRPAFLDGMKALMYGPFGLYNLDPYSYGEDNDDDDKDHKRLSFVENVRNRCALLNGEPRAFELSRHKCGPLSVLLYSNGVLVNHEEAQIYVRNLVKSHGDDWQLVTGDDMESFDVVCITPRYLLAISRFGYLYCWSARTLDRLVKVKLPSVPLDVSATRDTLVMSSWDVWFLYHLPTKTLSMTTAVVSKIGGRDWSILPNVEETDFIYLVRANEEIAIYHINSDGTDLDFVQSISLHTLPRNLPSPEDYGSSSQRGPSVPPAGREEDFLTDVDLQFEPSSGFSSSSLLRNQHLESPGCGDSGFIVVWQHNVLCSSPQAQNAHSTLYSLQEGKLIDHGTIPNNPGRLELSELIFFPPLCLAYDLICDAGRAGLPLGMYRVKDNTWKPITRPKSGEKRRQTESRTLREIDSDGSNMRGMQREIADDSWALDFKDQDCLWTGDSKFLICGHVKHSFTRIWRFT